MTTILDERRRKRVPISPELFFLLLTEGNEVHVRCTQGLPQGALFIGLDYDVRRDCFDFVFHHPSWEPVPFGEGLPELQILFTRSEVPNAGA